MDVREQGDDESDNDGDDDGDDVDDDEDDGDNDGDDGDGVDDDDDDDEIKMITKAFSTTMMSQKVVGIGHVGEADNSLDDGHGRRKQP